VVWAAVIAFALASSEAVAYKVGLVAIVFVGAIGLHILINWGGEISLAHAAFVGLPAFAVAQVSMHSGVSPILVVPIGIALGVVLGLVVAIPAMRARGLQVALVTLGVGIAVDRFLFTRSWMAGPPGGLRVPTPSLLGTHFRTSRSLVPVLVVIVLVAAIAAKAILSSKVGRALSLVRSNPDAAAAVGVPVAYYRGIAYAMAGAFAGLAGACYVLWVQLVSPRAFPLDLGFTYLVIAVLAGKGGLFGVGLSAVLLEGGRLFSIIPQSIALYLGPVALIFNVTRYREGFNGLVRQTRQQLASRRVRSEDRPGVGVPGSVRRMRPLRATRRLRGARPLLEVQGVSKNFGGVRALDDVSLGVGEGAIVGLIGPNGAGKTTLFNVVSGLLPPTAGSIRYDGHDIAHLPAYRRAARGIGRSFQNLGLDAHETVLTNVMTALHRSSRYSGPDTLVRPWRRRRGERYLQERCAQALARFGLLAERDRLVSDLPFAQARLVELAAVVAEEPRLMLLDEPTTGLDIAEVDKLRQVLSDIRQAGTTMVVVAHDVGFVMRMCEYVYVLSDGRLLFAGEPHEVQSHDAVIEAYLGASA